MRRRLAWSAGLVLALAMGSQAAPPKSAGTVSVQGTVEVGGTITLELPPTPPPDGGGTTSGSQAPRVETLSVASGTVDAPEIGSKGDRYIFERFDLSGGLVIPAPSGT